MSDARGNLLTLAIPPGSLPTNERITIAPLVSATNLPEDVEMVAGVEFGPDGLELSEAGSLTFVVPDNIAPSAVVGLAYTGDGRDIAIADTVVTDGVATVFVDHFSGVVIGTWDRSAGLQKCTASGDNGCLAVHIFRPDQARWYFEKNRSRESGPHLSDQIVEFPSGVWTLTFTDVDGWKTPSARDVPIVIGGNTSLTVSYGKIRIDGAVAVEISGPDSARWSLDEKGSYSSGHTVATSEGRHDLSFATVDGWTTPSTQTVSVTGGNTTRVTATYARAPLPQPTPTVTEEPVAEQPADPKTVLAEKFAPVLYVSDYLPIKRDDQTPLGYCMRDAPPGPVEMFLEGNRAELVTFSRVGEGYQTREEATVAALVKRASEEQATLDLVSFLDIRNARDFEGWAPYHDILYGEFGAPNPPESPPAVTYAEVWESPQGVVVQYWFLYFFNDFRTLGLLEGAGNDHEGDWEMITLVFDAASTGARAAQVVLDRNLGPTYVIYSAHASAHIGSPNYEGTHPVVYVSEGSHASRFRPGLFDRGALRSDIARDQSSGAMRVEPEIRMLGGAEWLSWGGQWGEDDPGAAFGSGPSGPAHSDKWARPFDWWESAGEEPTPSLAPAECGVLGEPVVAAINSSVRGGDAPLEIQFTDASSGGKAAEWRWSFGDGSVSDEQSPAHVFSTAGVYTVEFRVCGAANCDDATLSITVREPPPMGQYDVYRADGPDGCRYVFTRLPSGNLFSGFYNPQLGKGGRVDSFQRWQQTFSIAIEGGIPVAGDGSSIQCGAITGFRYMGNGEATLRAQLESAGIFLHERLDELLAQ